MSGIGSGLGGADGAGRGGWDVRSLTGSACRPRSHGRSRGSIVLPIQSPSIRLRNELLQFSFQVRADIFQLFIVILVLGVAVAIMPMSMSIDPMSVDQPINSPDLDDLPPFAPRSTLTPCTKLHPPPLPPSLRFGLSKRFSH